MKTEYQLQQQSQVDVLLQISPDGRSFGPNPCQK